MHNYTSVMNSWLCRLIQHMTDPHVASEFHCLRYLMPFNNKYTSISTNNLVIYPHKQINTNKSMQYWRAGD